MILMQLLPHQRPRTHQRKHSSVRPAHDFLIVMLIHHCVKLEHVDIFPVELKLDYKPKRVDYRALKEGKTIELMNFFHFDGSEMTLRHIEMFGVSLFS